MPPRLCILGSVNMDLTVHAPRQPAPGETLLGGRFAAAPGGKGANQAVAAARLGAEVSFVGCIGDDPHGRELLDTLTHERIDITHTRTRAGIPSGVGLITIVESGQNTIIVASGANATLTPGDADAAAAAIDHADVLLLQLEVPLQTVTRAARIARDVGATVILNAAPAAPIPRDLLDCVDVLIANEGEAELLSRNTPIPPPPADTTPLTPDESLCRRLAALSIPTSILTVGERGALFAHATEGRGHIPAHAIQPIDTVGAGDAFCGAFAVRLAEHQIGGRIDRLALMDAVCWGCAAGAIAATRHGAIPSLPTRAEVIQLLRRLD